MELRKNQNRNNLHKIHLKYYWSLYPTNKNSSCGSVKCVAPSFVLVLSSYYQFKYGFIWKCFFFVLNFVLIMSDNGKKNVSWWNKAQFVMIYWVYYFIGWLWIIMCVFVCVCLNSITLVYIVRNAKQN